MVLYVKILDKAPKLFSDDCPVSGMLVLGVLGADMLDTSMYVKKQVLKAAVS